MAQERKATTVGVTVGIRAGSTPHATATPPDGHAPNGLLYVEVGAGAGITGTPEDMLAFARAFATEVERAVPVNLLMAEWETAEEAVTP